MDVLVVQVVKEFHQQPQDYHQLFVFGIQVLQELDHCLQQEIMQAITYEDNFFIQRVRAGELRVFFSQILEQFEYRLHGIVIAAESHQSRYQTRPPLREFAQGK